MTEKKLITVDIGKQELSLHLNGKVSHQYPISTAFNGPGELMDSECTPRGKHIIADKIGTDAEINTVFVGRKPTGEIYKAKLRKHFPNRDWILTRILWLRGTEDGCNAGGNVDSYDRYIYIHGSPDDVEMGKPGSRGCIRMKNQDVIELFDNVEINTNVLIKE